MKKTHADGSGRSSQLIIYAQQNQKSPAILSPKFTFNMGVLRALTVPAEDLSFFRGQMASNVRTPELKTYPASPMIPEMPTAVARAKKSAQIAVSQTLHCGDARELDWIPSESVHLVLTSPPYWTLKEYPANDSQLGLVADYETFHDELEKVWRHCYRVLVPGGRLVCVVGDVCLSRRRHGRHMVMPLHADIVVRCRKIGFDNLNPIFWYKISNAAFEVENGSGGFLGKPYEPNGIIKNDMEFILMLRKSGGYRQPTEEQRDLSRMTKDEHHDWFQQIWTIPGESTRSHPAPYPEELAYRLVRMFSFTGDTVLDPFMGSGTTMLAAAKCGRNGIGVEIDPSYLEKAKLRLKSTPQNLFPIVSRKTAAR